ncbi:exodeoxyribonuclease I [Pseudomonas sp. Marseille-QA0892]
MSASIFWYDYETTGTDPRRDRPVQVAGIRTDEALNEIGEPLNLYCRLADDILPHPAACLVTGIRPSTLEQQGMDEAEFMARLHTELCLPETCVAGYNSLRFDDEVTRFSLYRNFHDPYGREWQCGNSRWDLIDLIRTAYALRPEGIEWPVGPDGAVSLKLELLTQANGLAHGQAHDALSDVRATIALARLVRERQPRLYDYLYRLRSKHRVRDQVRLLEPVVHVSSRYAGSRRYLAVVLPLAWHPTNRNAVIVCDLLGDVTDLLNMDAEQLRQRLYTRHSDLGEGERALPLKLVHINKCPVLAPMSVLRPEDYLRLDIDGQILSERTALLRDSQATWQPKLPVIFESAGFAECADPEQQLYDGFLSERDRQLCDQVRNAEPRDLADRKWAFSDERLAELLFRYRARNFPDTLTVTEQQAWYRFCQMRLSNPAMGAPLILAEFRAALDGLIASATKEKADLLSEWQDYAERLALRFALPLDGVGTTVR